MPKYFNRKQLLQATDAEIETFLKRHSLKGYSHMK